MKIALLKKFCIIICVLCCVQGTAFAMIKVKPDREQAGEEALQEPSPAGINYLAFKVSFVYHPRDSKEFKPFTNDTVLYSGESFKIIFTATEDCYVYIFQVDSANMTYQLFPMESFGGVTVNNFNPVERDKTYYLPAENKGFRLDKQTGTEKIYFLASRKRDLILEEQYQQTLVKRQQAKGRLKPQQNEMEGLFSDRMKNRKIVEVVSEPDEAARITWNEEEHTFSALQQRLENMCDGCVYVLTFKHR